MLFPRERRAASAAAAFLGGGALQDGRRRDWRRAPRRRGGGAAERPRARNGERGLAPSGASSDCGGDARPVERLGAPRARRRPPSEICGAPRRRRRRRCPRRRRRDGRRRAHGRLEEGGTPRTTRLRAVGRRRVGRGERTRRRDRRALGKAAARPRVAGGGARRRRPRPVHAAAAARASARRSAARTERERGGAPPETERRGAATGGAQPARRRFRARSVHRLARRARRAQSPADLRGGWRYGACVQPAPRAVDARRAGPGLGVPTDARRGLGAARGAGDAAPAGVDGMRPGGRRRPRGRAALAIWDARRRPQPVPRCSVVGLLRMSLHAARWRSAGPGANLREQCGHSTRSSGRASRQISASSAGPALLGARLDGGARASDCRRRPAAAAAARSSFSSSFCAASFHSCCSVSTSASRHRIARTAERRAAPSAPRARTRRSLVEPLELEEAAALRAGLALQLRLLRVVRRRRRVGRLSVQRRARARRSSSRRRDNVGGAADLRLGTRFPSRPPGGRLRGGGAPGGGESGSAKAPSRHRGVSALGGLAARPTTVLVGGARRRTRRRWRNCASPSRASVARSSSRIADSRRRLRRVVRGASTPNAAWAGERPAYTGPTVCCGALRRSAAQ